MREVKKFKIFESSDKYKEARDFFRGNNKFPHHSTVFVYEDEIVRLMEKYAEFVKNK